MCDDPSFRTGKLALRCANRFMLAPAVRRIVHSRAHVVKGNQLDVATVDKKGCILSPSMHSSMGDFCSFKADVLLEHGLAEHFERLYSPEDSLGICVNASVPALRYLWSQTADLILIMMA